MEENTENRKEKLRGRNGRKVARKEVSKIVRKERKEERNGRYE